MALLRRLKAWGAVEKNGRRLHLIKNSIAFGFLIGFGLLDMLLSRLQHGNLAPVQRVACALQWVNVVTVHLMPAHIRQYVEWHCADSEISISTISYIYLMLKITTAILSGCVVTLIFIVLVISHDKLQIKAIYVDIGFDFTQRFIYSNKKMLIKNLFITIPIILVFIIIIFCTIILTNSLIHIDFPITFLMTGGLLGCMLFPSAAIVRTVYLAARLMSGNEPREQ